MLFLINIFMLKILINRIIQVSSTNNEITKLIIINLLTLFNELWNPNLKQRRYTTSCQ